MGNKIAVRGMFNAMIKLMLAILLLSVSLANLFVIFLPFPPMFALLVGTWITVIFTYGVMYFKGVNNEE